ncbi:MAG: hypothetical protein ABEN55_22895 [Bradymonadaceae bacterium]
MRRAVLAAGLAVLALVAVVPETAVTQPKFAVEIEGGRNAGLTSYLDNVVYTDAEFGGEEYAGTEPFQPYLADERSGWGSNLGVRLVTNRIIAGAAVRWYNVGIAEIHHRGRRPGAASDELRPTRIRSDGTVDEPGVVPPRLRLPRGRRRLRPGGRLGGNVPSGPPGGPVSLRTRGQHRCGSEVRFYLGDVRRRRRPARGNCDPAILEPIGCRLPGLGAG